jgi:monoamine oxidase
VRQRCWERDDDIYGGASYTDLPIQQVWYPSDNATVIDDEAGARATRLQDIGDGSGRETSFALWGPDPQQAEPWRRPAILTAAYMTGINAERFCSLTDAERTNEVLRCLEILHPGIRADVAEEEYEDEHGARLRRPLVRHCSWIEQRTPGGGAWPYLAPGAHERYQDLLCAPHPENSPRVFFAGEHLCVLHGWMQGAIQSALEAAMAVMDAPH